MSRKIYKCRACEDEFHTILPDMEPLRDQLAKPIPLSPAGKRARDRNAPVHEPVAPPAKKPNPKALRIYTCGFCERTRRYERAAIISHLQSHVRARHAQTAAIAKRLKDEFAVNST